MTQTTSPTEPTLDTLPDSVLLNIFSKVEDSTLTLLGHVNTHLRNLSKNEDLWKAIMIRQMPSILSTLDVPSNRFLPISQYDPAFPQEFGISPRGFRYSYFFYLKLLKINKFRSTPPPPTPHATPHSTPRLSRRPVLAQFFNRCFSLSMIVFAIGMVLTTVFFMIAQETKRRHPDDATFLTSFTISGLFLLVSVGGVIEFLAYLLELCALRGLYLLSVIWMLPLLRLDDYIGGSHALALIPVSLILLSLFLIVFYFACCSSPFRCRNLLPLCSITFLVIGYVFWIVKLDYRSHGEDTFYNYTENGIFILAALLISSLVIPLLQSCSSSEPNTPLPAELSHSCIKHLEEASVVVGTLISLSQLLLGTLWQDKIIDCHYGIVLIPAWISLIPLVLLSLCSLCPARTLAETLGVDGQAYAAPPPEPQLPQDEVMVQVEAEKHSSIPVSDAITNFLRGQSNLA